ncbi:methionine synthase [Natronosporangium hydrolyticum]|uniref:Methionine synthase n=1 Tax=Natronosporangium hydrolyticum TaxID=2811111 RepID=A0A895YBP9_9ACTN|nr:methionine synthase [Natronosporangium hydrolyticum]QSB13652.1 methionine synthase [Natronosporangium hydrolyticum]
MSEFPWPTGAATGIGSLPGTDIVEAVKLVFGELPEFPYLPELPARGPGADMLGRSAGLLVDLPVELYAARWRVAARGGTDLRRIADLRERDLDALTEQAVDYQGPVKIQCAGPWTLATNLELRGGGPMLRDPGAVADLTGSLAEGLRAHLVELTARVPGARLVLQLDEASLPAVLGGQVPTESGFGTLPAVERATVIEALRSVVEVVGVPVVLHCCAPDVPVGLVREIGAVGVALDLDLLPDLDELGEALDAGLGLLAGAVPTEVAATASNPVSPTAGEVADRVRRLWGRLGFAPDRLPEQVVVTQACGLAGASPEFARSAVAAARDAARQLP